MRRRRQSRGGSAGSIQAEGSLDGRGRTSGDAELKLSASVRSRDGRGVALAYGRAETVWSLEADTRMSRA